MIGVVIAAIAAVPVATASLQPNSNQESHADNLRRKSAEEAAQRLFFKWWSVRRLPDSNQIPWGLVKLLDNQIEQWILNKQASENPVSQLQLEQVNQLRGLMTDMRDWSPVEAKALVRQLSQITVEPLELASDELDMVSKNRFLPGLAYRNEGASGTVIWGKPAKNGLRAGIRITEADSSSILLGTQWRGLIWLHNTGPDTHLVSSPANFPFDAMNLSAIDSDGKEISVVDRSPDSDSSDSNTKNVWLAPGQRCAFGMASFALGKVEDGPYVDIHQTSKLKLSFNLRFGPGDNPLIPGPRYSQQSRWAFSNTLLHQLLSPSGDLQQEADQLARLSGVNQFSQDKLLLEKAEALREQDRISELSPLLANATPRPAFAGTLPGFAIELTIDPISNADAQQELTDLFDELFSWDQDRRQRITTAKEEGKKQVVIDVLNEEIPYPRFTRMMKLAAVCPESEVAMEASLLTMKTTYRSERDTAMEVLVQHHAESSRIGEALPFTGYTSQRREWAETILKSNDSPRVVAHAKWAIGPQRANWHQPEPNDAVEFYLKMIRDYGDMQVYPGHWGVPLPAKTFGELAMANIAKIIAQSTWSVGQKLPSFSGTDLSGNPISLDDFRGKTTLVVFWATWCSPCLEIAKMEKRLLERFADQPFDILGVCGDFSKVGSNDQEQNENFANSVREKAASHGIVWRSIRDTMEGGQKVSELLGFPSLPYTVLIDGEGIVRSTNFINGSTMDPVEQERLMMIEIEKVLGGRWDHTAHLSRIERQHRASMAFRRVKPKLQKLTAALEQQQFQIAKEEVEAMIADDSLPLLQAHMLNIVAWTLYEKHVAGGLPKDLLAIAVIASELAVKKHPNDPCLLGTLGHLVHATGDLDRAISLIEKAAKLGKGDIREKHVTFLASLRRAKARASEK